MTQHVVQSTYYVRAESLGETCGVRVMGSGLVGHNDVAVWDCRPERVDVVDVIRSPTMVWVSVIRRLQRDGDIEARHRVEEPAEVLW
jgi:hypothetical protein